MCNPDYFEPQNYGIVWYMYFNVQYTCFKIYTVCITPSKPEFTERFKFREYTSIQ